MLTTFSLCHPWEPRFKSGFHNSFWDYVVPDRHINNMNDFGIILMKFGNEFWLILFREYISPNLFAVCTPVVNTRSEGMGPLEYQAMLYIIEDSKDQNWN
jgi:hypothetical protein